ncbi:MAG TPA: hypothetical protein VHL98_03570 [Microvirga sp.]|jgi:hypothetical protein|nr:hypothetical protein [Microvirga sp.]
MNTITIHDKAADRPVLGFDLKEILKAIGQPALDAFWTALPVEEAGDELWATGDPSAVAMVDELARTGERIGGGRLLEVASGIHQTIWGEFQGFESLEATSPWIRIVAFDSTWFEVHTAHEAVLERVRGRFKDVRVR